MAPTPSGRHPQRAVVLRKTTLATTFRDQRVAAGDLWFLTGVKPEAVPTGSRADHLSVAFLLGCSGATRAAYVRDLADWLQFCASHDLDPLAASRAHIDAYPVNSTR